MIEALCILEREWIREMNSGYDETERHNFSPEFEEKMEQILSNKIPVS